MATVTTNMQGIALYTNAAQSFESAFTSLRTATEMEWGPFLDGISESSQTGETLSLDEKTLTLSYSNGARVQINGTNLFKPSLGIDGPLSVTSVVVSNGTSLPRITFKGNVSFNPVEDTATGSFTSAVIEGSTVRLGLTLDATKQFTGIFGLTTEGYGAFSVTGLSLTMKDPVTGASLFSASIGGSLGFSVATTDSEPVLTGTINTLSLKSASVNFTATGLNLSPASLLETDAYGDMHFKDMNGDGLLTADDFFNAALAGNDKITGTADNNQLMGYGGADTVDGGDGNDSLSGGGGNDSLIGGNGDDFFAPGAGADSMVGGAGWDRASYAYLTGTGGYTMQVTGTLASGSITLKSGATVIETDKVAGVEGIIGTVGNDYISLGTAGAQEGVRGLAGNDTIVGGGGTDADFVEYHYVLPGARVVVDLASTVKTAKVYNGTSLLETDTLAGINGVVGTTANDKVTGGSGDDWFRGMAGSDTFAGGAGSDWIDYRFAANSVSVTLGATGGGTVNAGADGIDSFSGVENVSGSAFAETLTGNGYANHLRGNGGADSLIGGDGNDLADYKNAPGAVTVTWSKTINSGTAGGADGNDFLSSVEGVKGGAFNDTFVSGLSSNYFNGREGIDTVSYAQAGVAVSVDLTLTAAQDTRGAGIDTLVKIENLVGSIYGDTLTGDSLANSLSGNSGNDLLAGGGGADILIGGAGADILIGGAGADTLTGGDGNDIFRFTAATDTAAGTTRDVIQGFALGDKINLEAIDANPLLTGDQAFAFKSGGAFSGTFAATGQVYFDSVNRILYGNNDTDAQADFSIKVNLLGITTLTGTDLLP